MESIKQVSGRFKGTEQLLPQRTVLGLVLFLFQINDLPVNTQGANICSVC